MSIPVGGGPQNPFEKDLRVERIDADKLAKEDRQKKADQQISAEKLGVAAFLLTMFRKMVDLFADSSEGLKSAEQQAKNHLFDLKESLNILKNEDRSQDAAFLNNLSKIWQELLEDSLHFKAVAKFKELIQAIQHYPEHQPHTLGYYLTEYAGQKWIPFPYMELIQKIHTEHEKNPTDSALTSWTVQIDELALLLKVE